MNQIESIVKTTINGEPVTVIDHGDSFRLLRGSTDGNTHDCIVIGHGESIVRERWTANANGSWRVQRVTRIPKKSNRKNLMLLSQINSLNGNLWDMTTTQDGYTWESTWNGIEVSNSISSQDEIPNLPFVEAV